MKRILTATSSLLLWACVMRAPVVAAPDDTDKVTSRIDAAAEAFYGAIVAKDAARLGALFSPNLAEDQTLAERDELLRSLDLEYGMATKLSKTRSTDESHGEYVVA